MLLGALLCISQFLSCTPQIEPPPMPPASSSATEASKVLCLFGGVCTSITSEDCSTIGGQEVQSCPATSSSNGVSPPLSSSSSAVRTSSSSGTPSSGSRSSSSLGGLSSSSLPSSTVLCLYSGVCLSITAGDCSTIGGQVVQSCPTASSSSGSECIGSGSYCNYGGCAEWSSDGWSCARHINGYLNEGGCYPMPTEDNCQTGTLVSVCPANATPPTANYCKVTSSSSIVTTPSSSSVSGTSGTFTDDRDGKVYKWVKIGTQIWMAENLKYEASESKCYNNSEANCITYGRLYNWATAMDGLVSSTAIPSGIKGVCPSGWHLPSDTEWGILMQFVNPNCPLKEDCANAGTKLKATNGWNPYNGVPAGTDEYGFSALPAGVGRSDGSFSDIGNLGPWWSTSEYTTNQAYNRDMYYNYDYVDWGYQFKNYFYSVRCLKD